MKLETSRIETSSWKRIPITVNEFHVKSRTVRQAAGWVFAAGLILLLPSPNVFAQQPQRAIQSRTDGSSQV